eukprot:4575791-Pleurochrysis_carterae.AAC.1
MNVSLPDVSSRVDLVVDRQRRLLSAWQVLLQTPGGSAGMRAAITAIYGAKQMAELAPIDE